MLNDRDFLYGAAVLKLINFGSKVTVCHYSHVHPSLYFIQHQHTCSAVLFKLSTKPTSAWQFSLSDSEDIALREIQSQSTIKILPFLGLICHKDGVCCISLENLKQILDRTDNISGQSISVSRPPRGRYRVNGPGRRSLDRTIPQSDWPRIVL